MRFMENKKEYWMKLLGGSSGKIFKRTVKELGHDRKFEESGGSKWKKLGRIWEKATGNELGRYLLMIFQF